MGGRQGAIVLQGEEGEEIVRKAHEVGCGGPRWGEDFDGAHARMLASQHLGHFRPIAVRSFTTINRRGV